MAKYKLKYTPTIDAVQWTGNNKDEVKKFCQCKCTFRKDGMLLIEHNIFLRRQMIAAIPNDYIIKENNQYSVMPYTLFEAQYELMEPYID